MSHKLFTFTGVHPAGPISVPNLKAKDVVLGSVIVSGTGLFGPGPVPAGPNILAPMAVADDELLQVTANDMTGYTFTILIERND